MSATYSINGYDLFLTCSACPEQYDVFRGAERVGYLRLRCGWFYASVPDVSGKIVYEAEPQGDGCFEPDERDRYLAEAIAAIDAALSTPLSCLALGVSKE